MLQRTPEDRPHRLDRPLRSVGREADVAHREEGDDEHEREDARSQQERHAQVGQLRDDTAEHRAGEHGDAADDHPLREDRLELALVTARLQGVDEPRLDRAGEEREPEPEQHRHERPRPERRAPHPHQPVQDVAAESTSVPSRYDARRPTVSATMPVGISKIDHAEREEGVRGERLEVGEAGIQQEEGVDAPDERRRERVAEHQDQIGALDAAGRRDLRDGLGHVVTLRLAGDGALGAAAGSTQPVAIAAGDRHAVNVKETRIPAIVSLERLRASLADAGLGLPLEGAAEHREAAAAAVRQIDDYIRPRLADLDAPLLAVVGGSTGSGKSTIVNAMIGAPTTRVGVIRPTTRQPILIHAPADAGWFASDRILPGLARVRGALSAPGTHATAAGDAPAVSRINELMLLAHDRVPASLALIDAPDIDSVADENRALAAQLLAAADLWLFVTTANRYADAVPWRLLEGAAGRSVTVGVVLNRVPPGAADDVLPDLQEMLRRAVSPMRPSS